MKKFFEESEIEFLEPLCIVFTSGGFAEETGKDDEDDLDADN